MLKGFNFNVKKLCIFSLIFMQIAMFGCAKQTKPVASNQEAKNVNVQVTSQNQGRQMEKLDRGLIAVKVDSGVYVSWRLLGTEAFDIGFNVYRDGVKINSTPITTSTNYQDNDGNVNSKYYVRTIVNGTEQQPSETVSVWATNYLSIPLNKPADGTNPDGSKYTYSANDCSVGDVDGDGKYEVILKWDPSNSKDNSQDGVTGPVFVDAYKMDGKFLWRVDLGKNIRAGAHYTQMVVYDLDGDGKAEVALKTADGTVDGTGKVIGDKNADYRDLTNSRPGRVLKGPEYLTIFEGSTGKELATTEYEPARGNVKDWGDDYGNRVDRFLACVAYLDGTRPSLVECRGYYAKTALTAYNWRDGKLSKVWSFNSKENGNSIYEGQGDHGLTAADIDGDGKDEIVYGSCAIDDDGKGIYSTKLGHGDAEHVGVLDPDLPGLQVFQIHESPSKTSGVELHDAKTGKIIWGVPSTSDTGRGLSAHLDPTIKGEQMWCGSGSVPGFFDCKGNKISDTKPKSCNFAIWWDGDLQRELLDNINIYKWDHTTQKTNEIFKANGCASNNSTKATPCLTANLFGDWREQVIWRTEDSTALRIYTTTSVTNYRMYTLMHDPLYRSDIVLENVAYNQPPHTDYYIGEGMATPVKPNIYYAGSK